MQGHSLVQSALHASVVKAPEAFTSHSNILWATYHNSDAVLARITQLANGSCAVPLTTEWKADSEEPAKKLFVARLGASSSKRVLVVANEHARELITAEVALRFIEKACDSTSSGAGWKSMFDNVSMTIVPIANLAGRQIAEDANGDPCQRTTVKEEGNVDLNRNMEVDFEPDVDNHGPKPFSTYQARLLRDIAREESPLAYVDLHSGAKSLMVSWGARYGVTPDYPDQRKLFQVVQQGFCEDCEMGSNRVVIAYMNQGEIIDHMYAVEGIKYSTLWEVYQGLGSCFSMFNPPAAELLQVVDNWAGALQQFAQLVGVRVSRDERSTPGALDMDPIPPERLSAVAALTQAKAPIAIREDSLTT